MVYVERKIFWIGRLVKRANIEERETHLKSLKGLREKQG